MATGASCRIIVGRPPAQRRLQRVRCAHRVREASDKLPQANSGLATVLPHFNFHRSCQREFIAISPFKARNPKMIELILRYLESRREQPLIVLHFLTQPKNRRDRIRLDGGFPQKMEVTSGPYAVNCQNAPGKRDMKMLDLRHRTASVTCAPVLAETIVPDPWRSDCSQTACVLGDFSNDLIARMCYL
jgi:hypothetical protein